MLSTPSLLRGSGRRWDDLEKSKRIKKEERRLNQIFVSVPDNKKKTVEGLIKRAAFMRASLEDFEADWDQDGFVEMFRQGDRQEPYERKRPVADLYNTLNTSYQKIIKQLTDLLPEENRESDELLEFLGGGKGWRN